MTHGAADKSARCGSTERTNASAFFPSRQWAAGATYNG
jgi:hypothetical protein